MRPDTDALSAEELRKTHASWRAANYLSVFHLVSDVIDRLPQLGSRAAYAKQAIRDKLIEHEQYISEHGDDMPEITGWRWGGQEGARARGSSTEGDNV